jgi:DNA (cytosine-5)-methyltransferase 1
MRYLSLFSGIEAATAAWAPLGWQCVGVAEIDPFPCAVLAHHYPDVPNLGSVTDITDDKIAALGPIDLVVGGSPCQDLSVAGKRAGLAGQRSGLFSEQMRIFHAARRLCGARWLLWENVPGAFSTNSGRDFAVVVGDMAGCGFGVPRDGWRNTGVACGDNGLVEWSVLDAQWFGVPQRRRRVFALLDTGNWRSRPPILFERHSLQGHPPPSREAGEDPAARAARSFAVGVGADCYNGDLTGDIAATLGTRGSSQNSTGPTVLTGVAHTLRGEGLDASEDGTGRGTPLVPIAFNWQNGGGYGDANDGLGISIDHTPPQSRSQVAAIAFAQNQRGELRTEETVSALSSGGGKPGQGYPAVAFKPSHYTRGKDGAPSTVIPPLTADADKGDQDPVLHDGMAVRRLTPEECEALQGFSRGFTQIPWKNRFVCRDCGEQYRDKYATGTDTLCPAECPLCGSENAEYGTPDGPRYKALGNSMAVPVMQWIGERIQMVDAMQGSKAEDELVEIVVGMN